MNIWRHAIGSMDWAAIQDWMCEDAMLEKTGKSIREHQELTIRSYQDLLELDSTIPYLRHIDMYRQAGFDDMAFGLGSVCRRQQTGGVHELITTLYEDGFDIHAFGFKKTGLRECHKYLSRSDSMAWSLNARKSPALVGHTHQHCSNCIDWALNWRDDLLRSLS